MEDAIKRAQQRAQRHTTGELKERTFNRRLQKDYNKEEISLNNDLDNPKEVIIQTSRLTDKSDHKKISAPLELGLVPGQMIYWNRLQNNWLIYYDRNTEKDYFIGEIREAQYLIKWKDEFGVVREEYGVFSRDPMTLDSAAKGQSENGSSFVMEFLDGEGFLFMPRNEKTLTLNYYDKFVIGRNTWEVSGVDDTTYKNILMFVLRKTERNKDLDDKDLPNGQVTEAVNIYSNLDTVTEVEFGSSLELEIFTELNGKKIQDTYSFEINNCSIVNHLITFNSNDEVATITVTSEKTKKSKTYNVLISETPETETFYEIVGGGSTIKAQISYNYRVYKNINGEREPLTGTWTVDNENVKITPATGHEISVKPLKPATFVLSVKLENNEIVEKEIVAEALFA